MINIDLYYKTITSSSLVTAIAFLGLCTVNSVNAQTKLNSVPEISWSIRLTSFELERLNLGQVFTFQCPTAPTTAVYAPVWGTDTYTLNSGLCQAAVHSGMITQDGGLINVKLTAGESNYQGSDRFGISSLSHEETAYSFKFMGNPVAIESDDSAPTKPRNRPSTVEKTVGNGVRRGIERTISDSIRDIFR